MDSSLNVCANSTLQSLLKCWFCGKFLSVPPIYDHESGSICGRCKFVEANQQENSQLTRQILYESLAQFLIFPCSNMSSGCKAQLKWGEAEEHESSCCWKKINCPFIHTIFQTEKCKWMGVGSGLNEHLETCHGNKIQRLPDINFGELGSSCIFLSKVKKKLMVVTIKYESPGRFSCLVMTNGTTTECESYRYQVEFSDENKKNSIILKGNKLEDVVALDQNLKNLDKALVIEIPVMKGLLNSETVVGRFNIMKKAKQGASQEKNPNLQQDCIDDNILRELECLVCKEYMVPPIMICTSGHSFCSQCKEKMVKCPTCKKGFQKGRNYTLEKLSSCIKYPCIYREAGCLVTCSGEEIKEHEENCTFSGTHRCFLCSTKTNVTMLEHFQESHSDRLISAGEAVVLDISSSAEIVKYWAVCFENCIFKLVVWYKGAITFSLQQVQVEPIISGSSTDCSSYAYEIDVFYATDPTQRIIMGRECPVWIWNPSSRDSLHNSVCFSTDMVQRFALGNKLIYFKVYIKRVV